LATVSIRLDFPPATPPENPTEIPKEPTFISIQKTGSVFIGEKQTTPETLVADLRTIIGGSAPEEERIFIRADADVLYGSFMEVMNTLQDNGFFKIGLLGEDIS